MANLPPKHEPKHPLPQEWEEHFSPDAAISAVKTAPPIGEPLLDFSAMHHTTFEQFCWWLLKKDHTISGCKRLGRNGTAQGGIDLFAFDEQQPDKLHVFECKAWKDFDSTKLTKAVDAFLKGSWTSSAKKFTIILSQREAGKELLNRWVEEKQRMKQAGIEGELWTAHTLTLKVQAYPDILSKFFSWSSVELYANQWMQRVSFYELLVQATFDPRQYVAQRARELVAQPNTDFGARYSDECDTQKKPFLVVDGIYRRIEQYGNNWIYKGQYFSLSVILPNQRLTHASALFTFNRSDMQGIMLTVDHQWLLKQFLFKKEAPLTDRYRKFIVGSTPQRNNQYLIQFPHCRLFLEEDGVREIAAVADQLTDAMRHSLSALEIAWSSVNFPFVMWAGKKVALAAIDVDVWHEIGRFAVEHHVSDGITPWHMFDGNHQVLKPFHQVPNEHFDAGYHGVFYTTEIDGLSYGREVILMWQPNGLHPDEAFSPRGWWSCEFAFQWLNETLLPEIKRRMYERNFGRWKRMFHSKTARVFEAHLDKLFVARDLRQPPIVCNGKWSMGILESIQELQQFFRDEGTPEPYIRQHDIENLYQSVALIAPGKRGYVRYASSSLGLHRRTTDHEDLIRAIHEYISTDRVVANCSVADYALRAMLEMLGDSDAWLSSSEQALIRKSLMPFAQLRDNAILVDRHTRWV